MLVLTEVSGSIELLVLCFSSNFASLKVLGFLIVELIPARVRLLVLQLRFHFSLTRTCEKLLSSGERLSSQKALIQNSPSRKLVLSLDAFQVALDFFCHRLFPGFCLASARQNRVNYSNSSQCASQLLCGLNRLRLCQVHRPSLFVAFPQNAR